MNLVIKEINNKDIWEKFLLNCKEKTFLDSWNWGEFQKKEGHRIWRIGIYKKNGIKSDDSNLIGIALAIEIKAKRGTFLFIPHGPVMPKFPNYHTTKYDSLKILAEELKKIAKGRNVSFIRIAPIWQRNEENIKIFKNLGLKQAPIHMHPELTWELDITLPEEELLMKMRKTTRYLIRQASKNSDIEVIKSQDVDDLKTFNKIYQSTAKKQHFTPFPLQYLKNQFLSFLPDNQILIFLGKYKNEIVCSSIIVFWQNMAFYHHGASLSKYSGNRVPASYLTQWEAIKEAKSRGCEIYNFWGIAPILDKPKNEKFKIKNKKHPWCGLTLFKMGFGGYPKKYVKTQDLILSYKYYFTYFVEKIRKIKRRL